MDSKSIYELRDELRSVLLKLEDVGTEGVHIIRCETAAVFESSAQEDELKAS